MTVLALIVLAVAIVILAVHGHRLRRDFETHRENAWAAHRAHEERAEEQKKHFDALYGSVESQFDARQH
jgi:Ca2+/H+ antiporter